MTYEAYLDEVATFITKMYDVSEEAAIKQVMRPGSGLLYLARRHSGDA